MKLYSPSSLALPLSVLLPFILVSSPSLSPYSLQLCGALILLYFASKMFFRSNTKPQITLFFLISITSLLIFSTGYSQSPLFFLSYFLIFSTALLQSPIHSSSLTLTLIFLLIISPAFTPNTASIINLLTLALITPLSIIFSKNYLQNLQNKGQIALLEETLTKDQEESLLWIATNAKPSLSSVISSLSDIIVYLNSKAQTSTLPKNVLVKLRTIQEDLITLYGSASTLKTVIEEDSDNNKL